ncbi:MAG: hypothetical protein RLN81_02925 [Balneolaceae bacterium]
MIEHHFSSSTIKPATFVVEEKGSNPEKAYVILVTRKVDGKDVHICKSCLTSNRALLKYS